MLDVLVRGIGTHSTRIVVITNIYVERNLKKTRNVAGQCFFIKTHNYFLTKVVGLRRPPEAARDVLRLVWDRRSSSSG